MGFVQQALSFVKNLGLFLGYSCGYWASVFVDCIISLIPLINGVVSRIITFFQALFLIPIRIVIKVILQLFLLPVNIPLKLLLGTSLKHILLHATIWTDGYVVTTILQYWLALMIFGISVGAICGTSLSVLHSIWRIPDIYIEVPIQFWKRIPFLWGRLKKRFLSLAETQSHINVKESTFKGTAQTPPLTPSSPKEGSTQQLPIVVDSEFSEIPTTPKYKYDIRKWSRPPSISKESILKVASKLPSDFFQQGQPDGSFDEESQQNLSPSQLSQTTTQNSSAEFTDLWDKVEESPITLRTDDGFATLSRRKKFPDHGEKGVFVDK